MFNLKICDERESLSSVASPLLGPALWESPELRFSGLLPEVLLG